MRRCWMTLLGVLLLVLLPAVQARPPANDRELGTATRAAGIEEDSGTRVALLIGVWKYKHVGRLVAPQHDIAAMDAVLTAAGWEVRTLPNPRDRAAITDAVTAAAREAGEGSTVMVYYAGHAAQQDNTNHLFPAGVQGENCYTYESETVRVGWILAELDKWGVKAKVMVLDACRNNPFPACDRDLRSLIGEEGYTPDGTLLAFSTRKGSTASDGNAKTSPYTTALSQHLATPGLDLTVALAYTARDTKAATSPPQEPWFRSGLDGSLVITPITGFGDSERVDVALGALVITVASGRGDVLIDGQVAWSAQSEFDTQKVSIRPGTHRILVGDEEEFITIRPGASLALEFRGEPPASVTSSAYPMVHIEPDFFHMGSSHGYSGEKPVRAVQITRPYLIGESEVTQELWESVIGSNPSRFSSCGGDCPVESMSWLDAVQFANQLSEKEGLEPCYEIDGEDVSWPSGLDCEGYRLPTEAEWEYAARAGSDTKYHWGNSASEDVVKQYAWYENNAQSNEWSVPHAATKGIQRVKQKRPNAWGLYDTAGNVAEWTWDWYQDSYSGLSTRDPLGPRRGSYRVCRGGGWYDSADDLRVAYRFRNSPGYRFGFLGVRLAKSL